MKNLKMKNQIQMKKKNKYKCVKYKTSHIYILTTHF